MSTNLSQDQILRLRKELRGYSLMPMLEKCCREKHIARRTTVFAAVSYDRYRNENPIHRLVVIEAISLVAQAGGDVEDLQENVNESAHLAAA